MLGLGCGMQDLPSSLQHVDSLVLTCGTWFPDQESSLGPLDWELRDLATGSPRKSETCFKNVFPDFFPSWILAIKKQKKALKIFSDYKGNICLL